MPEDTGHAARPGGDKRRVPRRDYSVAGLSAGLAALSIGVLVFTLHQEPHITPAAAGCGLVHCNVSLPAAVATSTGPGGSPAAVRAASPRAGHASAQPSVASITRLHSTAHRRPSPAAHPSPGTATSPGPAGPPVTVTYVVDQTGQTWGGPALLAHFTLVNHTAAAVTGWTLQSGLPGDWVHWVSTSPDGRPEYPNWSPVREGVIIAGPQAGEAIPAHGSLVFYLYASGQPSSPAGCTFNGPACQP